jgi:hypothetical protein
MDPRPGSDVMKKLPMKAPNTPGPPLSKMDRAAEAKAEVLSRESAEPMPE